MSETEDQATQIPWPLWMYRYIATDDESAFMDLVWSVGGSPPYGGISYDEAAAVYELLEDYRGPGMATAASYEKVEAFIADHPDRSLALEAFRINDEITSSPESFGAETVARGTQLAEGLGHDGLRCLFLAYRAQLAHRDGDLDGARDHTIDALKLALPAAEADPAYGRRVAQLAQNAVSFTALAGDREGAIALQSKLQAVMDPNMGG